MGAAAKAYTPAQAAALSEVALKAVHNAIDKRIVLADRTGGGSRRVVMAADLLRLKLWYGVGAVLSADRRQRLFDAITTEPAAASVRADEFLIVDVEAARRQLADRVRQLEDAEALVRTDPGIMGGEPVFAGTRVPVRIVAAMRDQGASVQEIVEGYPSLTPRMIDAAAIWVTAHPPRGRPRRVEEPLERTETTRVALPARSQTSRPAT